MSTLLTLFSGVAIAAGVVFFIAGSVALLRFPDAMSRLHALTKADSLGLGLIVLGLLPWAGGWLAAIKLILVWLLVLLAGAVATQLIAERLRREEDAG